MRRYTGSLCGTDVTNVGWATGFADCDNSENWSSFFSDATQHYYVGGGACNSSAACTETVTKLYARDPVVIDKTLDVTLLTPEGAGTKCSALLKLIGL